MESKVTIHGVKFTVVKELDKTSLPLSAGVYCISVVKRGGVRELWYVGCTINIRKRMFSHVAIRQINFLKKKQHKIEILFKKTEHNFRQFERWLICATNPKLNLMKPLVLPWGVKLRQYIRNQKDTPYKSQESTKIHLEKKWNSKH